MSAMYSQAWDHMPASTQNEEECTYSDPELSANLLQSRRLGGRGSAFKVKSQDGSHHTSLDTGHDFPQDPIYDISEDASDAIYEDPNDTDTTMGQESSSTYIDFDLKDNQDLGEHGVYRRSGHEGSVMCGHTNEDENEYCYAYSQDIVHDPSIRSPRPPIIAQRSVSLDDEYSQPSDRVSKSSVSSRTTSLDYVEPYHSHVIQRNPTLPEGPPDPGGVYELAKSVSPTTNLPPNTTSTYNDPYNHLDNTTSAFQGVKLDDGSHLTQSYDHLNTWSSRIKSLNSVDSGSSVYNSAESSPLQKNANISDDVFTSNPVDMTPSVYSDIPANYEEPWDSEEGQIRFKSIMNRAGKQHEKRRSVDQTTGVNPTNDQPQMRVKNSPAGGGAGNRSNVTISSPQPITTQRVSSATNIVPDEAFEYSLATDPNQRKPNKSDNKSPSYTRGTSSPSVSSNVSGSSIVGNMNTRKPVPHQPSMPSCYEDAWDLPEKQKEFDDKLQQARLQRASKGQIREEEEEDQVLTNRPGVSRRRNERKPSTGISVSRQTHPPASPTRPKHSDERVLRSDSCRSLGALSEKIDKSLPLLEQNFYHGMLKRSESERILVVFKEGSYLIRKSETSKNDYSLTLKGWNNLPMHMKISCKADGTYILGENSPPFRTIPDMVDYYTSHELPVQNAQRICLLYPIPN